MNLTSVKPGDIVRAGGSHAEVRDRPERGVLLVRWLGTKSIERRVKAREVEEHWRRAGRARVAESHAYLEGRADGAHA